MQEPIVDFSFIYEMSGNDATYIYEVIDLFLKSVPDGLSKLEQTIRETDDFAVIQKQAHFLKSSANVIKIRGVYADLVKMESLARAQTGKDEINKMLDKMLVVFNAALPFLEAEKEKNRLLIKSKSKK
jgi:HPt (histidine-containing phosphotransfer) domain-containing protein